MQNGFLLPDGSCARVGFPVQALAPAAGACRVALGAARRAGVPVIYTRYTYRSDFADGGFMLREKFPMLAQANALVAGTWDQAIVDGLEPRPADLVVDKNRPSAFHGTALEGFLRGLGVSELVVCGVTTSCCVESTIRDAAHRDFRSFLLTDAVADWESDRHLVAMKTMGMLFAHPLNVGELEASWT
jgi:ureidoacrylate peracid hydrolase